MKKVQSSRKKLEQRSLRERTTVCGDFGDRSEKDMRRKMKESRSLRTDSALPKGKAENGALLSPRGKENDLPLSRE